MVATASLVLSFLLVFAPALGALIYGLTKLASMNPPGA
jgi:hypothetical protein